jgi:ML-like domain
MDLSSASPLSRVLASHAPDGGFGRGLACRTKVAWWLEPSRTLCWDKQRLRGDGHLRGSRFRQRPWFTLPAVTTQLSLVAFLIILLAGPIVGVFIKFDNCLDKSTIESEPPKLQFIPLHFYADFSNSGHSHTLNLTVYGNVSGSANQAPLPSPTDPMWNDPNNTLGKIVDVDPVTNIGTTLSTRVNVLSYTPYYNRTFFCSQLVSGSCPIGPVWSNNSYVINCVLADTVV